MISIIVHNPVNTFISFGLLIAIVGGSFYYVYALAPRGPWMGIMDGAFITPGAAQAIGLDEDHGFLIFVIAPSSPAAKVGLQQADDEVVIGGQRIPVGGDIIVSMDGRQINGIDDICSVLEQKQVGDNVRIGINRDGRLQEVNLILEEAPPGETSDC
ncbi:putative protease [Candidatus Nitrososphaera gargensis Ga9.2]|uniref:Putative protease n=1 Tax=Nitrososphaera gargensis (strain Ga9.2) TaxID=1237085 RepID=K0IJ75_NITGG|nr:PDZ domain-containing protein [Candidatus Nitrososphaera gargensis]AFU58277.1 putative protease [Candidatus Nitrososphaera gargensis Ga9.2]